MDEDDGAGGYRVFLLKLWRADGQAGASWRCSLEDPSTHARRGFEDVCALASFLSESYGHERRAGTLAPPVPAEE